MLLVGCQSQKSPPDVPRADGWREADSCALRLEGEPGAQQQLPSEVDTTKDCIQFGFSAPQFLALARERIRADTLVSRDASLWIDSLPRFLSVKGETNGEGLVIVMFPFTGGRGYKYFGFQVTPEGSKPFGQGAVFYSYFGFAKGFRAYFSQVDGPGRIR